MKKLTNILKHNWTMAMGLTLLVGIVALNGGCDDPFGGYDPWGWVFDPSQTIVW